MMSMKNVNEGASAPISEKTADTKGKSATLPMMDIRPVPIEKIRCTERIRTDEGDIEELSKNIGEFGLINPITVMEQEKGGYVLIAGYRRMKACAALGFNAIMATVLTAVAAEERLRLEISENVERKDFTTSEKLEFSRKLRVVEEEKSRQRMSKYNREKEQKNPARVERPTLESESHMGRTREIVAKAVGMGSGRQLERAEYLAKNRPDLLEKVDNHTASLYGAYMEARAEEKEAAAEKSGSETKVKSVVQNPPDRPAPEERTVAQSYTAPENKCSPVNIGLEHPELWKPLDVYYPGKDKNSGAGIKGANHFKLMENRIYETLYQKYREAIQSVNVMVAGYSSAKSNMEMQIRSINSNLDAVIRERDELKQEREKLKLDLNKAEKAGQTYHQERDELRKALEEYRKENERLEQELQNTRCEGRKRK